MHFNRLGVNQKFGLIVLIHCFSDFPVKFWQVDTTYTTLWTFRSCLLMGSTDGKNVRTCTSGHPYHRYLLGTLILGSFLYLFSFVLPHRTQNFGGKSFRRTKFFGGQNFRHQVEISAVLSAEILSDKVFNFDRWTILFWLFYLLIVPGFLVIGLKALITIS